MCGKTQRVACGTHCARDSNFRRRGNNRCVVRDLTDTRAIVANETNQMIHTESNFAETIRLFG